MPKNVSIATVANSWRSPRVETTGVPITVRVDGLPVFTGATLGSGQTSPFTVDAGKTMAVALGQADISLDRDEQWHGHVVGKVVDIQVSTSYVQGKSNGFTQVLSQPFARNIHVVASRVKDMCGPAQSPWWDIIVRKGSNLSFRSNIAPVLNMVDIDGVFRFLSGAPSTRDYIFGLYFENDQVDLGDGNVCLTMRFNGKTYVAGAKADVYHFLPDGVGLPPIPFSATVVGDYPGPEALLAVQLDGSLPEGKTLVMFRADAQPGYSTAATQVPVPTLPTGGGGAPSPDPCGLCVIEPTQEYENQHKGGCTPSTPTSACPITLGASADYFKWVQVGITTDTQPGSGTTTVTVR